MKTLKIKLYRFKELSKKAQANAIQQNSDINTDNDWWECTYEDAENIGLKLGEFTFDSASFVRDLSGNFTLSAHEVAANIIRDHGNECETYKTAQVFLDEVDSVQSKYEEFEGQNYEDEMMAVEEKFLNDLLIDYKNMLQSEYDEKTSEAGIKETILINNYFFFEDGVMAHCTTYTGKHKKAGITELHFHGQTIEV